MPTANGEAAPLPGTQLDIKWEKKQKPVVPVIGKVVIKADGKKYAGGSYYASGDSYSPKIATLPPDIKIADVVILPDAADAEKRVGVDRIWGLPIELKDVSFERLDQDK